jgi:hypothetical protein
VREPVNAVILSIHTPMIGEFLVLVAAALLAFVISASSRWLALCTTAAGGLTAAYFFMPPEYSFRVANTEDYITLLAYGTGGVLLTHVGAKRRRRGSPIENVEAAAPAWRPRRTCAAEALREALSHWDAQLRTRGIQVRCGALPLPQVSQPHDDVVRVFSDLAAATVRMCGVEEVWIHGVELPGRQRFFWCVEKARRCGSTNAVEPVPFPAWPDSVRASTVDNEFERMYEVTFST